jgi:hypothetical protein
MNNSSHTNERRKTSHDWSLPAGSIDNSFAHNHASTGRVRKLYTPQYRILETKLLIECTMRRADDMTVLDRLKPLIRSVMTYCCQDDAVCQIVIKSAIRSEVLLVMASMCFDGTTPTMCKRLKRVVFSIFKERQEFAHPDKVAHLKQWLHSQRSKPCPMHSM